VGREILVAGLVLLDRGDDPPMRGDAVLACAPAPSLAHISDYLKHILE
jgi:hypothetical protein